MIKRIRKFLHQELWWRKDYHRVKVTMAESLKGRCLICQGGIHSHTLPTCFEHGCPCKHNERLIYKYQLP